MLRPKKIHARNLITKKIPAAPKSPILQKKSPVIGHVRVPKTLIFKMRLGAQPFFWKWVLFAWKWKIISISKAEHLTSFWNRGPGKLGNGLLFICKPTGSPSLKYEHQRASALLQNILNIRICIEKNPSFLKPTKMKGFQWKTAYLT